MSHRRRLCTPATMSTTRTKPAPPTADAAKLSNSLEMQGRSRYGVAWSDDSNLPRTHMAFAGRTESLEDRRGG